MHLSAGRCVICTTDKPKARVTVDLPLSKCGIQIQNYVSYIHNNKALDILMDISMGFCKMINHHKLIASSFEQHLNCCIFVREIYSQSNE